jgi:hypothetical protein
VVCCAAALAFAAGGQDDPADPGDGGTDAGVDGGDDTDGGDGAAAVSVSAGGRHTCAVIDGGDVKCWGSPQLCQLGYGYDPELPPEGYDSSLPSTLPFVDVGGNVAQIVAGGLHTCALLATGGMKCWGTESSGELGVPVASEYNGTIGCWDVPADHAPIDFGVAIVQAAAGDGHTCALLEGGDVVCWGDGEHGETGYGGGAGYDMDDPGASARVELGGAAVRISAGLDHTCAVLGNGDVYCWGDNQWGQLGLGDTEDVGDDELPSDVGPVDLGGPAAQVSCGYYHTCAVLESGDVVCWGLGDNGQLGYGNTDTIGNDEAPASVGPVDVGDLVVEITTGERFTCVRFEGGGTKCWGAIAYGLGYIVGDDEVPAEAPLVEVGGPVAAIDGGLTYVCALMQTGSVRCWGNGPFGQLGYGPGVDYVGDDETPASMGDVPLF